jgi:hypothetical protein
MPANTASAYTHWLAIGLAGRVLCTFSTAAAAQSTPAPEPAEDESAEPQQIIDYDRGPKEIGIARFGSQGTVGYADFDEIPISRIGELLENVPGLIATQHSGSGKAKQFFLRGFNLDHLSLIPWSRSVLGQRYAEQKYLEQNKSDSNVQTYS